MNKKISSYSSADAKRRAEIKERELNQRKVENQERREKKKAEYKQIYGVPQKSEQYKFVNDLRQQRSEKTLKQIQLEEMGKKIY